MHFSDGELACIRPVHSQTGVIAVIGLHACRGPRSHCLCTNVRGDIRHYVCVRAFRWVGERLRWRNARLMNHCLSVEVIAHISANKLHKIKLYIPSYLSCGFFFFISVLMVWFNWSNCLLDYYLTMKVSINTLFKCWGSCFRGVFEFNSNWYNLWSNKTKE